MSKSMAIEGVMKIFLMIAVIVVGMSFLLKAFGIDIIGWLKDKFSSFGVVDEAIALHVKFDPDQDEIWEFHLTNGESNPIESVLFDNSLNIHGGKYHLSEDGSFTTYFGLETLPTNGCLLLTTDENGGFGRSFDDGRIYVIKPGTTIQAPNSEYNSLRKSIDLTGQILERYCNHVTTRDVDKGILDFRDNKCSRIRTCGDKTKDEGCHGKSDTGQLCFDFKNYLEITLASGPSDADFCDYDEKVLDQKFSDIDKWSGACEDQSKGKKSKECDLLKQQDLFTIDFGLICDGTVWKACTKQKAEKGNEIAQSKKCQPKYDYFVWK